MTPQQEDSLQTALAEYEAAWDEYAAVWREERASPYGTRNYSGVVGCASRLIGKLRVSLDTERAKVRVLQAALARIEACCVFPEETSALSRSDVVKVAREALDATSADE